MVGRPSQQNPSIRQLTLPPETIPSCYPENAPHRIPTAFRTAPETFGYNFNAGEPTEATLSYRGFKGANSQYRKSYAHSISFDVASYFNSIYHHDLVHWFE